MKIKLTLIIFLIFTIISYGKYSPLKISQLIDQSDIIGNGEIIQIKEKQITVKFQVFVKGKTKNRILNINKFENWTCAMRWTNYKVGQKEMMFLKLIENKKLIILGAGNEGEMPIYNNFLYYKAPYGCLDKDANQYKVDGQKLCGFAFKISEVENGIREYLKNRNAYVKMTKKKFKQTIFKNHFLERLVYELYESY